MTEETTLEVTEPETMEEDTSPEPTEEKVEVSWEDTLPVLQALMQKNEIVSQLGQLLIEAESKKDAIKEKILNANEILQNAVQKVRTAYEVPSEQQWELDLPEKEGSPAFFVKKN